MKLVIHGVDNWGENLRTWTPDDPKVVAETVTLKIGERGKKAADLFTIRVATPAGLDTLESRDGIIAVRPLLVIREYNFSELWNWLQATVAECEADTWLGCVEKLCRYFNWEYDNYKEP